MASHNRDHTNQFVEDVAREAAYASFKHLDMDDIMSLAADNLEVEFLKGYESGKDFHSFNLAYEQLESQ